MQSDNYSITYILFKNCVKTFIKLQIVMKKVRISTILTFKVSIHFQSRRQTLRMVRSKITAHLRRDAVYYVDMYRSSRDNRCLHRGIYSADKLQSFYLYCELHAREQLLQQPSKLQIYRNI
jgi:hypothetical protein